MNRRDGQPQCCKHPYPTATKNLSASCVGEGYSQRSHQCGGEANQQCPVTQQMHYGVENEPIESWMIITVNPSRHFRYGVPGHSNAVDLVTPQWLITKMEHAESKSRQKDQQHVQRNAVKSINAT